MSGTRTVIVLTEQQKNEWASIYEATKKLPSNYIPCSKCNFGITATHGNLIIKVEKFGGIKNLLTQFVCRDCTKQSEKKDNTPKAVKPPRSTKTKHKQKPLSKLDVIKDETGRYNIPLMSTGQRQQYSMEQIAQSPTLTQEFTNNVCLRPTLYFNSDSSCDNCNLFEHCGCSVKKLSKAKLKSLNNS